MSEPRPESPAPPVPPGPVRAPWADDPVAQRTKWTPLYKGAANFATHKLVRVDPDRVEFRSTRGATIFGLLFLLAGLGLLVAYVGRQHLGWAFLVKTDMPHPWAVAVVGGVFALAGAAVLSLFNRPLVFDLRRGCFQRSRASAYQTRERPARESSTDLAQVHALQLLAKTTSDSDSGTYLCYELNLVLKDGSRLDVVCHGDRKRIRADAQALAEFLGKPLWDAA